MTIPGQPASTADKITVSVTSIEKSDLRAAMRFLRRTDRTFRAWVGMSILTGWYSAAGWAAFMWSSEALWPIAAFLGLPVMYLVSARLAQGTQMQGLGRFWTGTYEADEDGLTRRSADSTTRWRWQAFETIDLYGEHVLLRVTGTSCLVLPVREFAAREDAERLVALAGRGITQGDYR